MLDLANKIQNTQDLLKAELAKAATDLRSLIDGQAQNVKTLEMEYAAHEKQEQDLRALSVEYDSLKSQADAAKAHYAGILDRLNQTQTTKAFERIPLRALDQAQVSYSPIAPKRQRIMRTCFILGAAIFVALGMGLNFIDDRIKSTWDVEHIIGVRLIGILPQFSSRKRKKDPAATLGGDRSQAVEPFLRIYSSMKTHSRFDYPKSLLITSTSPGEGKTLVSTNLAATFARHSRRVVLMDCDLRCPMLHRHFRMPNNTGLVHWFDNGARLEGSAIHNPHLGLAKVSDNFWVLPSGGHSKSPTRIFENPVFGKLIEKLKQEFDLVVIDSPPMGVVADPVLIAERADEILYVCRFNLACRRYIKLHIRTFLNRKDAVLGIVLNRLSTRRIAQYSDYRSYRQRFLGVIGRPYGTNYPTEAKRTV